MTPADKRITELLDRWLTSIELHLKYTELDDASYRQVQPWPEHERPVRWVLEAAQQKVLQLKTLAHQHIAAADSSFAEGLELMAFLANLVGSQNVRRFVPLADPKSERPVSTAKSVTAGPQADAQQVSHTPPVTRPATATTKAARAAANEDQATREMPALAAPAHTKPAAQTEIESTREMPRLPIHSKPVDSPSPRRATTRTGSTKPAAAASKAATTGRDEVVVADAVRLLKWGRQWHELVELIARMAERPAATEIRRILRQHKSAIESQLR